MRALRSGRYGRKITSEEMGRLAESYVAPSGGTPLSTSSDDYLVIEGLQCTNADRAVFEEYSALEMSKNIFRNTDRTGRTFTPYEAIVHCEGDGLFLPSTALTFNILAYLYEHRSDEAVASVLQQYKGYGAGFSWHAQNTVVEWKQGQGDIIHYPTNADFPSSGSDKGINSGRNRISFHFLVDNFANLSLEEALRHPQFSRFVQNLTGLADPGVLVSLGINFSLPAKVWVPDNVANVTATRAVWVGCDNNSFNLSTNSDLGNGYSASGVREPPVSQ